MDAAGANAGWGKGAGAGAGCASRGGECSGCGGGGGTWGKGYVLANAEALGVGLPSCDAGIDGMISLGTDAPGVGTTCSALDDFVRPGEGRASGLRISACVGASGILRLSNDCLRNESRDSLRRAVAWSGASNQRAVGVGGSAMGGARPSCGGSVGVESPETDVSKRTPAFPGKSHNVSLRSTICFAGVVVMVGGACAGGAAGGGGAAAAGA